MSLFIETHGIDTIDYEAIARYCLTFRCLAFQSCPCGILPVDFLKLSGRAGRML